MKRAWLFRLIGAIMVIACLLMLFGLQRKLNNLVQQRTSEQPAE